MRLECACRTRLDDLKAKGVRPKYHLYHPDRAKSDRDRHAVNAPGRALAFSQDHGVPIFEDECYADLIWDGRRPPALYALSNGVGVIHIGSFSKSISPALRVGCLVANWDILSRILALKIDAGSGAFEQMVLAEFCGAHFAEHVRS